jgi:two-component system LytT family response regulator
MLRCIIADDESGAVEVLTRHVKRTKELELAGAFRESIEALSFLAENPVDLVFLDIDMPRLDGMRLAGLIRNTETQVVFCTAYSEYAVESYEKGALDYLLKPISYERFRAAVDRALEMRAGREREDGTGGRRVPEGGRRIFIKSGPRLHQLSIDDLLYMEKKDHYVVFHVRGEEILSRMNMAGLLETLPAGEFVQVHRSWVVAVDKIDTIDKHHLWIGDRKIPIGNGYREELLRRIRFSGQ